MMILLIDAHMAQGISELTTHRGLQPVPLKKIQPNLEFNDICHRHSLKKTDPITTKFLLFPWELCCLGMGKISL